MTATLYRKYRPQTFADVVGQEHVTTTLINQIKHAKLAHAYLFAGPRGVGKTTTARLLAKAIQASDPKTGEPDESNHVVTAMTLGRSLDLIEIDAASNRRIEEIRELREHVKYPPNQAKYKVFIIDEVHMLTTEAFNALLKTLEEPPKHVVFILATTELHKLPETIVSRCQRFDFKPVSHTVLAERLAKLVQLEKATVDPEVLDAVIRLSGGCVRDAEGFLGQLLSLGKKYITLDDARLVMPVTITAEVAELMLLCFGENTAKIITQIQKMYDQGNDIKMIMDDMMAIVRVQLLWKVGLDDAKILGLDADLHTTLHQITAGISSQQIHTILHILFEHIAFVAIAPLPILPLEMAALAIQELFSTKKNNTDPSAPNNTRTVSDVLPVKQNKTTTREDITSAQTTTSTTHHIHDAEIWNPVLAELKQENPALAQYLVGATVSTKGNTLTISVAHPFHFEIANKAQNIALLTAIVEKVVNQKPRISILLDEGVEKEPSKHVDASFVQQIASDFGGQVVG